MLGTQSAMATQLGLYLQLGKFRLSLLVVFTTAVGYGLGASHMEYGQFGSLLLGTILTAMGANGLNQCWEKDRDGKMLRTRKRPIPSGRMSPEHAFFICLSWLLVGLCLLYFMVNPLTSYLAVLTLFCYLLVYTPLKPFTSIAVLAGAIPGAIPPVMGWTAATNEFSPQAWVLACILYLWQIPHFMALATLYQQDYAAGGYQLLPDNPAAEHTTRSIVVVFSAALLAISLLSPAAGLGTGVFFSAALILGLILLGLALRFYKHYSLRNARQVFIATIVYLPVLMSILLLDQRFIHFHQ